MKARICLYCGARFAPRRKGISTCSPECRSVMTRSKSESRNSTPGGKADGGVAGRDVSPDVAPGSITLEAYRNLMRT